MPPRGCSRPGWRPWACWGQVAERELNPVTVIDVNDVKGDWCCAVNDVNDVTIAIRWMTKGGVLEDLIGAGVGARPKGVRKASITWE